ncbi:MAG: response regulator [Elusimicrobia bacterium]|nr:response regulator [Elusimicrobiota bacterium]
MDIVFFFYGLAFALLGTAILIQRKKDSRFELAGTLWLLAAFGVIHALNEFLEMWRLIRAGGAAKFPEIDFPALVVSFSFLFEFGRRTFRTCAPAGSPCSVFRRVPGPALPFLLALIAAVSAFSQEPLNTAKVLARYLLGFPGAVMAGAGLLCFSRADGGVTGPPKARSYFAAAGAALLAYGLFSGLVVNKAGFFPANLLNAESFLLLTGLPVQVFRAACAAAMIWGVLGGLKIFHGETEKALAAANQELKDIIEFLPDPAFVVDGGNAVIAWNKAMEKFSGTPKAEMLGRGNFEYALPFYGERRPALLDFVNAAEGAHKERYACAVRTGSGTLSAELFLPRLNGGAGAYVWAKAAPLLDPEGKVFGAIETLRDITGQKRAEELRQRLEAELRQAQKMEVIGRLAGGVAHDFNNLLTAILNYSAFLLKSLPENSPEWSDAAEIRKAGERGASLTRQLLAFSRKQTLSPRVLAADDVVGNLLKLLSRVIGEDIQLSATLKAGAEKVKVDPEQMEQAVINLAVNARDAMPGGGRLALETAVAEFGGGRASPSPLIAAGRYFKLALSDTGHGMSAEVLGRIFEPFFTTKGPGKGTGLGLSGVQGFITQSGGHILVESAPGKGSVFTIYLPVTEEKSEEAAPAGNLPGKTGRGETVLLVEDDEAIRKLAGRVLTAGGYEVLSASGPEEALSLCERVGKTPAILITDMVMPGMNGLELAKLVSARLTGIKVLFMSGYSGDVLNAREAASRELAFLGKPFSPEALLGKTREVLDAGRG